MFDDRRDAGKQLAQALVDYRGQDVIVLVIPRGGVEVGYRVAKVLDADFSLLVVRKLSLLDSGDDVDEVVCAATPRPFFGVEAWYRDFSQMTDKEVKALLRRANGGTPD
jgi:predicted phosphoribosyltransferase